MARACKHMSLGGVLHISSCQRAPIRANTNVDPSVSAAVDGILEFEKIVMALEGKDSTINRACIRKLLTRHGVEPAIFGKGQPLGMIAPLDVCSNNLETFPGCFRVVKGEGQDSAGLVRNIEGKNIVLAKGQEKRMRDCEGKCEAQGQEANMRDEAHHDGLERAFMEAQSCIKVEEVKLTTYLRFGILLYRYSHDYKENRHLPFASMPAYGSKA